MKINFLLLLMIWNLNSVCFGATSSHDVEEKKTYIVTCASGELGGAIAKKLAKTHNIIMTGRDTSKLYSLQDRFQKEFSNTYEVCRLDYSNKDSISQFAQKLNQLETPIHGIVIITPRPHFERSLLQKDSEWTQSFQDTFIGPLEALKSTLPHMRESSKIVVIAGTTSVQLQAEYGPACVIRRMWTTYSKALSHQLGARGISINVLSPGVVLTHFHREKIQKKADENCISFEEQMEKEVSHIPLHRHAQPEEVANSVQFLLSPESDFINGVNIVLDGGATVSY